MRYLELGLTPADIARKAAPGSRKRRKVLRTKIWRALEGNPELQARIAARAQAKMAAGLIPMTDALIKRGQRGRPDAIKLAFEASGFHNPRVKHEHSGDIKISLDMPRPARVDDDADVIDAEVVDD